MDKQQIFNRVYKHLVKQGCKSVANLSCLYRGPNGMKCAVGCLIPDDLYDPLIEGVGINSLLEKDVKHQIESKTLQDILNRAGVGDHIELLSDLQKAHDQSEEGHTNRFMESLTGWLEHVAKKHGLTMPKERE